MLAAWANTALLIQLVHPEPVFAGYWKGPARAVITDTRTRRELKVTDGEVSMCGNSYGAYYSFQNQNLDISAELCTNHCKKVTAWNRWQISINGSIMNGNATGSSRELCIVSSAEFRRYCWRPLR